MTATAEETARQLSDEIHDRCIRWKDTDYIGDLAEELITAALLAHGAAERERCAAIADQRANICLGAAEALDDPSERCAGIEARHIADLIRALASAATGRDGELDAAIREAQSQPGIADLERLQKARP